MALHSRWYRSIVEYYQMIQEQYSIRYLREILLALFIAITVASGYFLHKMYVQNREQQAFVALSEVVDSFMQSQYQVQNLDKTTDREKIVQAWSDTDILLDALYKEHVNSYLAPFFLAFKADIILQRDGNVDAALEILDSALGEMSKNSPVGSLYVVKRIKMGLDSKQAEVRAQSLQQLIDLTHDEKSYAYQQALYLLAQYYFSIAEKDKAKALLNQLVQRADANALIKSAWVLMVEEMLDLKPATVAVQ